ncbi:hypothetical protein AGDE_16743 [Angomonas deanei]|nr:hypothetical protein AGDE_16743 [Angomonas deanei]|eukprot:EPY16296.1 hypothetical protein AGDE_16743 [Angomonas deanei]
MELDEYESIRNQHNVPKSEIRIRRSMLADMYYLQTCPDDVRYSLKEFLKLRYSVYNPPVAPQPTQTREESGIRELVKEFMRHSEKLETARVHPHLEEVEVLFSQLKTDLEVSSTSWREEARAQFYVKARENKLTKNEVILGCCLLIWDIAKFEGGLMRLMALLFLEKSESSRIKLHNVVILSLSPPQIKIKFGKYMDEFKVPLFPTRSCLQDMNEEILQEVRGFSGGSSKAPAYLKFYREGVEKSEFLGGGISKENEQEIALLRRTVTSQQETIAALTLQLQNHQSTGNRGRGGRGRGYGSGNSTALQDDYGNPLPKNS